MRQFTLSKPILLTLSVLLSAPALAWVPKLEEVTAKNVIDGAYGRRDPVPTFQTLDLTVKEGKFAAGTVTAFAGGEKCVADWLAAPTEFAAGSRPQTITVIGQADQLYFQAQAARDAFGNLTAADALAADLSSKRMPDGQLRVDIAVKGLASEKARQAYNVRLKGSDGKMIAPIRATFVNDFKLIDGSNQVGQSLNVSATTTAITTTSGNTTTTNATTTLTASPNGLWQGTLVYYFEPLKAGIGASDKVELLLRTEADTNCAYSVPLDLGSFS
ncbi:hypothetical protein [Deinococcus puniceus]|uniref:hypothetical protein n=1 Tax=Deinococcus puniceus TaxID=1182568 RepID=UPI0007C88207|nr:hypothetical protein [Deinococcus puniceus]